MPLRKTIIEGRSVIKGAAISVSRHSTFEVRYNLLENQAWDVVEIWATGQRRVLLTGLSESTATSVVSALNPHYETQES